LLSCAGEIRCAIGSDRANAWQDPDIQTWTDELAKTLKSYANLNCRQKLAVPKSTIEIYASQFCRRRILDEEETKLQLCGVLILGKQSNTLLCTRVNKVGLGDDSYCPLAAFIERPGLLDDGLIGNVIARLHHSEYDCSWICRVRVHQSVNYPNVVFCLLLVRVLKISIAHPISEAESTPPRYNMTSKEFADRLDEQGIPNDFGVPYVNIIQLAINNDRRNFYVEMTQVKFMKGDGVE
jgi:hypothetical protein